MTAQLWLWLQQQQQSKRYLRSIFLPLMVRLREQMDALFGVLVISQRESLPTLYSDDYCRLMTVINTKRSQCPPESQNWVRLPWKYVYEVKHWWCIYHGLNAFDHDEFLTTILPIVILQL